jgi:hypothetical protein
MAAATDDPIHLSLRAWQADDARARVQGIIPNLERRYRETDSVMVREELARNT